MPDAMFFSKDMRSLRRGKRVAPRTPTCRPCLVYLDDDPGHPYHGVVMDVSPYGMRIRMLEPLPVGCRLVVQMMRDEDFSEPLSAPIDATVARSQPDESGLHDHGVHIVRKMPAKPRLRPVAMEPKRSSSRPKPHRYTYEVAVGEDLRERFRR